MSYAIQYIPEIIKSSIFIAEESNKDKNKHPNIEKYKYLVSGLKIGNEYYTCKSAIGVDKDGNHYYDQRLSQIEKGLLLNNLSQLMSRGKSEQPLYNYDKRLLRVCQCPQAQYLDKNLVPTKETVQKKLFHMLFFRRAFFYYRCKSAILHSYSSEASSIGDCLRQSQCTPH